MQAVASANDQRYLATLRTVVARVRDLHELRADPELAGAGELVAQVERVMQAGFDQMQSKAQLLAQTSYREALKAAAELWQRCVDEWGRSRGYRQAVAAFSREWFSDECRESRWRVSCARCWSVNGLGCCSRSRSSWGRSRLEKGASDRVGPRSGRR